MNKLLSLLFLSVVFPLIGASQCPECEPDTSCGEGADFPTTCPEVLPSGVSGEYYEQVITFFLPAEASADGITATIDEIIVSSITGLPFGMEITINDDDNTFYPGEGQNYGCATLCGTPLAADLYDISINVQVTVTAFGFEQVLNESFISPLLIEQGENANASFSYDQVVGCGPFEVSFQAEIDASPSITEYSWDFGNGNSSTEAIPEVQAYNEVGEYLVTLETTVSDYVLNQVIVTSLSSSGSNDIDEIFGVLNMDPYLVVLNSSGTAIYTSDSQDGAESASFLDLDITLLDENYTVQIWDSDALSADDLLGEYVISTLDTGSPSFNDDGTNGSLTISLEVSSSFNDIEEVLVFAEPNGGLSYSEGSFTLSLVETEFTEVDWYLNGTLLENQNNGDLVITSPGEYYAVITNEFGCSTETEFFTLCPEVTVNEGSGLVFTVGGFETYTWFYNGLELDGEMGNSIPFQGLGNYAVEITTDYGCTVESEVLSIVTSIATQSKETSLKLYPNPVTDVVNIVGEALEFTRIIITDQTGTQFLVKTDLAMAESKAKLDLSHLASGVYFINMYLETGEILTKRVVKL